MPRTDIFSLGAVLYEMTTGAMAFGGKTSAITFKAILDTAPRPPTELNPAVPGRFEEIIHKALEKDPDMRYQSAADLRADLKRLRRDSETGRPLTASSSHVVGAARPFYKRHLGVAVGLLLAAILIPVGYFLFPIASHKIESIAVLPFSAEGWRRGGRERQRRRDGVADRQPGPRAQLKVKSRNSVFRYKGQELDLQKIGKELGVNALVTGRVIQRGNTLEVRAEVIDPIENTQIWGQTYRRSTGDILGLQQQVASDIASKLRSTLSSAEVKRVSQQGTQNAEAYALYLKGRQFWTRRTLKDLREAVVYFNQAIDKDPAICAGVFGDCGILQRSVRLRSGPGGDLSEGKSGGAEGD